MGETVLPGDNLLVDAGDDKKAAGSPTGGRYYHARATSAMYVLDKDTPSQWVVLPAGVKVLDGEYSFRVSLSGSADTTRWYYSSTPATTVTIPVEQLLHIGFHMAPATDKSTPLKRAAIAKGAVVLSEADDEQGMDALAQS